MDSILVDTNNDMPFIVRTMTCVGQKKWEEDNNEQRSVPWAISQYIIVQHFGRITFCASFVILIHKMKYLLDLMLGAHLPTNADETI